MGGVEHGVVHVDINDIGASLGLGSGYVESLVIFLLIDEAEELAAACHIGALANLIEGLDLFGHNLAIDAREPHEVALLCRHVAFVVTLKPLDNGGNMRRRAAAATANDVDRALVQEILHFLGHHLGSLVILSELVGQSGIRVCRDKERTLSANLRQVGHHIPCTERAVEAESEQIYMTDGIEESVKRLARKDAPALIRHSGGHHDGEIVKTTLRQFLLNSIERRLGVKSVKHSLDKKHVDASVQKAAHLLTIGFDELVECYGTETRVVDIGAH